MDPTKDYYRLLGARPGMSVPDLRRAYIILVKQCHPDSAARGADEERAKALNEAYDVLSDPVQRATYDEHWRKLHDRPEAAAEPAPAAGPARPAADPEVAAAFNALVRHHPELRALDQELAAVSAAVAAQFRAQVARSGNVATAAIVAKQLELAFLSRYFGSQPVGRRFARGLLINGEREAAKEFNQLVKDGASPRELERLIGEVRAKYRLDRPEYRRHRHRGVELAIGFDGEVNCWIVPPGESRAKEHKFRNLEDAIRHIDRVRR